MNTIHIAAALMIGGDGKTLLVRKRGTHAFMQPGGKIEVGESALAALVRELNEELGLIVYHGGASYLGQFSAPAANEQDATVIADLFSVRVIQEVHPAREIEEVRWIDPHDTQGLDLAPLTADHVLPLYRRMLSSG